MFSVLKKFPLENDNGLYYSIDYTRGRIIVSGSYGEIKDLYIPSHIESLPVTVISQNAFENNKGIVRAFIPKTVEDINERAFNKCESLKDIFISNDTKFIAYDAFSHCDNITLHCNEGSCAFRLAQIRSYKQENLSCPEFASSVLNDDVISADFNSSKVYVPAR